jgi:hypothetical protein
VSSCGGVGLDVPCLEWVTGALAGLDFFHIRGKRQLRTQKLYCPRAARIRLTRVRGAEHPLVCFLNLRAAKLLCPRSSANHAAQLIGNANSTDFATLQLTPPLTAGAVEAATARWLSSHALDKTRVVIEIVVSVRPRSTMSHPLQFHSALSISTSRFPDLVPIHV